MSHLPHNLLSLRTKLNISRREFCNRINQIDPKGRVFSQSSYNNHETGVCEPSIDALILYSELHNVTVDELIKTKIK